MIIKIELEEYNEEKGIQLKWEDGFKIKTELCCNSIIISANKAGLISLASHMLALAQDTINTGTHIHLDEYNSLENNSLELIIQKTI